MDLERKRNKVRFTRLPAVNKFTYGKLAERRQYAADVCYGNVENDDSHFPF